MLQRGNGDPKKKKKTPSTGGEAEALNDLVVVGDVVHMQTVLMHG